MHRVYAVGDRSTDSSRPASRKNRLDKHESEQSPKRNSQKDPMGEGGPIINHLITS
jgi:hypothetical protein